MLAFMRHGETDWNRAMRFQGRTDVPLNKTGRQQARDAAQRMLDEGESWDAVVTSPLSRARETGQIVAETLGAEFGGTYDGLIERSFGSTEGKHNENLTPEEYAELMVPAEPEDELVARALQAVQQVASDHPGRDVLMVTHGSLIRIALNHWSGDTHPRIINTQVLQLQEEWIG